MVEALSAATSSVVDRPLEADSSVSDSGNSAFVAVALVTDTSVSAIPASVLCCIKAKVVASASSVTTSDTVVDIISEGVGGKCVSTEPIVSCTAGVSTTSVVDDDVSHGSEAVVSEEVGAASEEDAIFSSDVSEVISVQVSVSAAGSAGLSFSTL